MSDKGKKDCISKEKSVDLASEVIGKIDELISSNNNLASAIKDDFIVPLDKLLSKLAKEYENRVVNLEKINEISMKAIDAIAKLTNSEEELKNDKKNLIKEIEELQSEKDRIHKEAEIYKKQVEDYRNKTVVKITELQEKLDIANQNVIDKQTEFDKYVKTIEDERTRERILQQEALKQKESEYKEALKKQVEKNKELEKQLEELKK